MSHVPVFARALLVQEFLNLALYASVRPKAAETFAAEERFRARYVTGLMALYRTPANPVALAAGSADGRDGAVPLDPSIHLIAVPPASAASCVFPASAPSDSGDRA